MISSSIILAVEQFSALTGPILKPLFVKTSPAPMTPEEPSTLALALIGMGIVAAYVGVKRLLRPQREPRQLSRQAVHTEAARMETPTRGAA